MEKWWENLDKEQKGRLFQLFNSYIEQPVWGVPVTVFGAAAAGAALSLFFGDPLPTRRAGSLTRSRA